MSDHEPLVLYRCENFHVSGLCVVGPTVLLQWINKSADRIRGNDEIIRKATNSIMRRAELYVLKGGGHFEQ